MLLLKKQPTPYSGIMKLITMVKSLQDVMRTRNSAEAEIEQLHAQDPLFDLVMQEDRTRRLQKLCDEQQREVDALRAQLVRRKAAMEERRQLIKQCTEHLDQTQASLEPQRNELAVLQTEQAAVAAAIHGQQRRICEELAAIFPITAEESGPPLAFRIVGLPLPNTRYDPSGSVDQEQSLSAALGFVAQLVSALQHYLAAAFVPYAVRPFGSRSSICDEITPAIIAASSSVSTSTSTASVSLRREYPLYLRGGADAQTRLDHGWFLLNRDIEALCHALSLRLVDLTHTLPNLKYLLYVGSAGSNELPQRKKGGVKGLLMDRVRRRLGNTGGGGGHPESAGAGGGSLSPMSDYAASLLSPTASRRGSFDSECAVRPSPCDGRPPCLRDVDRNADGKADSSTHTTVEAATAAAPVPTMDNTIAGCSSDVPVIKLFDESAKLLLRTKGMREHHDDG